MGFAQSKANVSIKFHDREIYYPADKENNPIYIHITIANTGTETFRFKLANDRNFSVDFQTANVKNKRLAQTQSLVKKRTTNQTVYFKEIALESGEEYSFIENLKDYIEIESPSIYYISLKFYPELYENNNNFIESNRLSLQIRPSPNVAASSIIPITEETSLILQKEEISPDKVVEQTIIARQKSLWDQYFLYMDLEEMLKRDPVRNRRYSIVSAEDRILMLRNYREDLKSNRIDKDIVAVPSKFVIEKTEYSQTKGSVKVIEWFDNGTFLEKKRFTYYVKQQDGVWMIYDYTVDNLGTE